jgi:hypothetical protein
MTCKETLRPVLSEAHPPPLHTDVYLYVYSILIHSGKGGELNQREG